MNGHHGGQGLRAWREEMNLSQEEAAEAVIAHAAKLGIDLRTTGNQVSRWERAQSVPSHEARHAINNLTGVRFSSTAGRSRSGQANSEAVQVPASSAVQMPDPGVTDGHFVGNGSSCLSSRMVLDTTYVQSLHGRIADLVTMDIQFGGDQSAPVALRLFRSVARKIGAAACEPGLERDLYAAAGELGEVAGWLLYDAGQHDLVRRVNSEALSLSQLAGDTDMELLIWQNMSMHAGHLGYAGEALRIAQMVLDTRQLSPRLEALFRVRLARALAQRGDQTSALTEFERAQGLYGEGLRDTDPAWAWWICDQELAWHQAMISADGGHWSAATDAFAASIELTPGREVRRRYNHLSSLLTAQIQTHSWVDVEATIGQVLPYVDEVGSTRTATTLLTAAHALDTGTGSAREAGRHLRAVLAEAGYTAA